MGIFDAIHRRCPTDGYYVFLARSALSRMEKATSLNKAFREWAKRRYVSATPTKLDKSPKWASELYQTSWLALAVVFLCVQLGASGGSPGLLAVLAIAATYRLYEILVFSLHWTVEEDVRIYSFQRSLIGFVFNIFEISAFTTFIRFVVDGNPKGLDAFAELGRGMAAVLTLELGASSSTAGRVLNVVRLTMSSVLVILVLSNLVGGISKESVRRESAH